MGATARSLPPRPGKEAAGGIAPSPAAAASRPVRTASTPGMASARLVSTERMMPCAAVERANAAWAWPGRSTSSVKRPRPVSSGPSSLRRPPAAEPKRSEDSGAVNS